MRQIVTLFVLSLLAPACGPYCPEQFERGVYLVSGDTSQKLGNRNGRLYSMYGWERVSRSELKEIALIHVLVLAPDVETRGGGGGIDIGCLRGTATLTWRLGHWKEGPFDLPDRRLVLNYDGKAKSLRIGSAVFPTVSANCFVVRLDEQWEPTTTTIPLLLARQDDLLTVMEAIRNSVPDQEDVQQALLYDETKVQRDTRSNLGVPADRDPRERGSRPLNTNR